MGKNQMKKNNKQKGFSIIEVVVAIGIVTVGLFSVMMLMNQNTQVQVVNKNNLIASMLAQEGLELVRNMRDMNWLDPADPGWDNNITLDGDYTIDNNGGSIEIDSGPDAIGAAQLYLDANGLYVHENIGNTETLFYRLITVDDTNPPYLEISSHVRWSRMGNNYDYIADTVLYDWR